MYNEMLHSVTRRQVLAGTAGAAVAAAALSAIPSVAHADEPAPEAPVVAEGGASYLIAPDPVDESLIGETVERDVIVIGSGVSGMCMGCRLAELGVSFKLFTAGSAHVQRGGSFHGIDTTTQAAYGISYKPADLGKRIKQEVMCGSYYVDQPKWTRWILNNTEAMNWLIAKAESYGCRVVLEEGYHDEDYLWDFTPASHNFIMLDESLTTANGGIFSYTTDYGAFLGAGLINDIYQHEIEEAEPIDWRTKAEYLEKDGSGRVVSVVAQKLDENGDGTGEYVRYVGNKGIVMATGDFSQNQEMMAQYCPWVTANDMLMSYPVNYDAGFQFGGVMPGDGQKMGLWIGAAWQKGPNACLIDSLDGPYHKEIGNVDTINLNKQGKRFMNEDVLCSYSAIACLQQTDHEVFYVWPAEYADQYEVWDNFGATIPSPEDGIQYPTYCSYTSDDMKVMWAANAESGAYVSGSTIQEVLEGLEDIDVEQALATIEQYNQYCRDGYDPDFMKNPSLLTEIASESGVYYGYKITMGPSQLLGSTGGLRTNDRLQVCDANDEPIEGLYNIGVMTGDMYANNYNFCICGHNLSATCTTFPYLLAQDLADMA